MTRYAALLRGINVGGNNKIAMADLRAVLAGLGFTEIATLLQSGNAAFTSRTGRTERLAADIEAAITNELGMTIRCLVRTASEVGAVIEAHPFAKIADNGSKMMALFLSQMPSSATLAEFGLDTIDPRFSKLGERVIYQWCPGGTLAAPQVTTFVEKKWKITVTARNWNTVNKLAVLLDS